MFVQQDLLQVVRVRNHYPFLKTQAQPEWLAVPGDLLTVKANNIPIDGEDLAPMRSDWPVLTDKGAKVGSVTSKAPCASTFSTVI